MDAGTENLWQSYRDRLRAFVRSRVKDDAAVEDILQRAFLQMHQALRGGKSLDDPHAWVFAVTRNALRDHYRTEKSQTSRVAAAAEESRVMPEPGVGVDAGTAAELTKCVEPLLRGLEQPYRDALQWTAFDGMTQEAASKRANMSLSGMKSRVQRGRTKLRDLFENCCTIEVDARGKPIDATRAGGCSCETDE